MIFKKEITCFGNWDVVVAGGGTAGVVAAIAAARRGQRVLLLEKQASLGGSITMAQVLPEMSICLPGINDNSSINILLKRYIAEMGGASENYSGWFSIENYRLVAEQACLEFGVALLYETVVIDSCVEKETLTGLVIHNRNGLQTVTAKVFIDATGDAVVAHQAGVPCLEGRPDSGENQPMSLRFMMGNVDIERAREFMNSVGYPVLTTKPEFEIASLWSNKNNKLTELMRKGVQDGVIIQEDGEYFQAFSVPGMPGVISFNCPEAIGLHDANSQECVTKVCTQARAAAFRIQDFIRKYIGGFENACIFNTAAMPGIRESRRIQGQYMLTAHDYAKRRHFEDAIAQTAYPIDIHGMLDKTAEDEEGEIHPLEPGEYVEIPYRCLVPVNVENLLVAGRCISTDFIAQSAIRIQRTCKTFGEAAGVAADMAIKRGCRVSELDGADVRNGMLRDGCLFLNYTL